MKFYQSVLGGDLQIGTAKDYGISDHGDSVDDAVVHAVLTSPSGLRLMAWDAPDRIDYRHGNNVAVFIEGADPQLRDCFSALSTGGIITRPLEDQTWGVTIGALVDQFGITWMFRLGTTAAGEGPRSRRALPTAESDLDLVLDRLTEQPFRARFKLYGRDRAMVDLRGINTIRTHAKDLIRKRVAPAEPHKDGRQTPYRGHPVFVAQHATATCCRTCLSKWHGISVGHALDAEALSYVVNIIVRWIERQYLPGRPPS